MLFQAGGCLRRSMLKSSESKMFALLPVTLAIMFMKSLCHTFNDAGCMYKYSMINGFVLESVLSTPMDPVTSISRSKLHLTQLILYRFVGTQSKACMQRVIIVATQNSVVVFCFFLMEMRLSLIRASKRNSLIPDKCTGPVSASRWTPRCICYTNDKHLNVLCKYYDYLSCLRYCSD